MKLIVKVLQGSEFEIQIAENALIIDVKREINRIAPSYPVEFQKVLSSGRTLLDDKTLDFYKIKDMSKLMLVIKKPDPLKDVLTRQLKKFYSEDVTDKIVKEFMLDFDQKMNEMSLDDFERLATSILGK
ncbi:uncharacterized protein LOC134837945 [Culicoides brevitarsis]|uniref:uncharacterized protein LOC134837945 n=1 Tax=Culicoides brevitarsis TaxID=469753 RepID=UPI00307C410C